MATIQVKVCHVSCTVTIRRLIPKIHGLVNPSHSEQHHLPALERLLGKASSPTQALFQENQYTAAYFCTTGMRFFIIFSYSPDACSRRNALLNDSTSSLSEFFEIAK